MDDPELRHEWMGHIGDPKARMDELRRTVRWIILVGALLTAVAIVLMIVGFLLGSPTLTVITLPFWPIGLTLLIAGWFRYRKGGIALARNEMLTDDQKRIWIDEGKLESEIDDLLYINGFAHEKRKQAGYVLVYALESGIGVSVTRFSNVIQILIDGINERNAGEAKRLRRVLDGLDLPEVDDQ